MVRLHASKNTVQVLELRDRQIYPEAPASRQTVGTKDALEVPACLFKQELFFRSV